MNKQANTKRKPRAKTKAHRFPCNALTSLRTRYFSHASESAARYGVTFDRIVQHLWDARRRGMHLPLRSIFCVDDLAHVIGCIDRSARAWHDLIELYEPWLVRQLRNDMNETDALLAVRQFFIELRRDNASELADMSLQDYLGDKPLRNWLAARAKETDRTNPVTPQRTRPAVGGRG